jgi:hypothetical protein
VRLKRVLSVLTTSFRSFGEIHPVNLFLFLVVLFSFTVWVAYMPPSPPPSPIADLTDEQMATLEAELEVATKARKEQEAITALRCKAKSICKKYGTVRQECATAGNYNNCLRIKMGSEAYGYIGMCTEEGGVADSVPNAAECLLSSVSN